MSIIGTRPPLISETNLYELHHRARLAIKPGITGMWQVSAGGLYPECRRTLRRNLSGHFPRDAPLPCGGFRPC